MFNSVKDFLGFMFFGKEDNQQPKNPNQNSNTQKSNNNNQGNNNKPGGSMQPLPGAGGQPPARKNLNWGKILIWTLILGMIGLMFWSIFGSNPGYYASPQEIMEYWTTNASRGLTESKGEIIIFNGYVQANVYVYWGSTYKITYVLYFDTIELANAFFDSLGSQALGNEFNLANLTTRPDTGPGFFVTFFFTWLPWIIFMVIGFVIIRKMMDKQSSGKISKKLTPQISNIRFKDISGYSEVKAEMSEVVDFLRNPFKYSQAGARTPKGVLLAGAPGTGKTLWAKAIAGEAGAPFYSISGSDFVEMYVGVGASRVRTLFETAKASAPSIIFIDEIDAVGRQRGAGVGGGNDEREQTLNQLLVEMDGFSGNSGVIVLAATNRPDVLDPALKRPGRFDREITIRLPDVLEREAILKNYATRGAKIFAKDVDFINIAMRTPGFSGAELENVINEATILSIRMGRKEISLDILDEAIDRVIGGPAKQNLTMTQEEKRHIAYHESGHAIIGLVRDKAQKVQKISIIARGMAGGYVLMTPKVEKMIQTKSELIAKVTSYLGGRASEEVFFGAENISNGASSDIHEATQITRKMVTEWGMSNLGPIEYEQSQGSLFLGRDMAKDKKFSSEIGREIDREIKKIIDEAYNDAIAIVKEHRDMVELFADALFVKETLNSEEIEYIFEHKKLTQQILDLKEKGKSKENKN